MESVPSTESVAGKVFGCSGDARAHGKGGIWYTWRKDSKRSFPEDVASVFIVMPVNWGETPDKQQRGIVCEWTVDRVNQCGARWSLSGTREAPTLSPSLHWVGVWHGWLRDGQLTSC